MSEGVGSRVRLWTGRSVHDARAGAKAVRLQTPSSPCGPGATMDARNEDRRGRSSLPPQRPGDRRTTHESPGTHRADGRHAGRLGIDPRRDHARRDDGRQRCDRLRRATDALP